jgi:UDP-N-acetylmuramoyl-tripeptide--D-alanyl-D-alanine ligase
MRFRTLEVCDATDGVFYGREPDMDGVTIDSRQVVPGNLFVPIVAERDGHDFIGAANRAGAAAYLTAGPIEAGTAIRVEDTAAALTALGRHARTRLGDRVVGITGSVGKTSLKDLLRAVGSTTWRTWANPGSFNNELGVPLTLCNAPDETELTVVEMGARGIGHIADLCAIAQPTVGVVTVVAGAHLEQFGSLDGVAEAKGELVEALPSTGFAVLNADDPRVAAMAARTSAGVVSFGIAGGDVRAEGVELDEQARARFVLRSPWGEAPVQLAITGAHQVVNALGAATAALVLGASVDDVARGLAAAELSAHRTALHVAPAGFRVVDDAYNANPTSMLAALDTLVALPAARRFAVLGTMAELGPDGAGDHRGITEAAAERGITVVAVGESAYGIGGDDAVDDVDAAVARLDTFGLGPDDAVLVKASRSARLERVVDRLVPRAEIEEH